MLSKEGEVVGTPVSGAQICLAVFFRGLATQTAAHPSTVQVYCGEYKYPQYPMSG